MRDFHPQIVYFSKKIFRQAKIKGEKANVFLPSAATSPTFLATDLSLLLPSTVCQRLPSSWQPSPTNRAFPVVGPRTWNDLPSRYPASVSDQNLTCSRNCYTDFFLDWLHLHLISKRPRGSLYHLSHFENLRLIEWLNDGQTSPGAAVEFDAHADRTTVRAVWHDADPASNDRRTDVSHLRHERVDVPLQYLHRRHTITIFTTAIRLRSRQWRGNRGKGDQGVQWTGAPSSWGHQARSHTINTTVR